jgi:hypothetical protein
MLCYAELLTAVSLRSSATLHRIAARPLRVAPPRLVLKPNQPPEPTNPKPSHRHATHRTPGRIK